MTKCLLNSTWIVLFFFLTTSTLVACSGDDPADELTEVPTPPSGEDEADNEENSGGNNDHESTERNITIAVNGTSFAATLEDNEAGRAFAAMLPLTLDMSELNGNEKYHYLDESLPTDSYRPGNDSSRRFDAVRLILRGTVLRNIFFKLQLYPVRQNRQPRRTGGCAWQRKCKRCF